MRRAQYGWVPPPRRLLPGCGSLRNGGRIEGKDHGPARPAADGDGRRARRQVRGPAPAASAQFRRRAVDAKRPDASTCTFRPLRSRTLALYVGSGAPTDRRICVWQRCASLDARTRAACCPSGDHGTPVTTRRLRHAECRFAGPRCCVRRAQRQTSGRAVPSARALTRVRFTRPGARPATRNRLRSFGLRRRRVGREPPPRLAAAGGPHRRAAPPQPVPARPDRFLPRRPPGPRRLRRVAA